MSLPITLENKPLDTDEVFIKKTQKLAAEILARAIEDIDYYQVRLKEEQEGKVKGTSKIGSLKQYHDDAIHWVNKQELSPMGFRWCVSQAGVQLKIVNEQINLARQGQYKINLKKQKEEKQTYDTN